MKTLYKVGSTDIALLMSNCIQIKKSQFAKWWGINFQIRLNIHTNIQSGLLPDLKKNRMK